MKRWRVRTTRLQVVRQHMRTGRSDSNGSSVSFDSELPQPCGTQEV